jgi:hypothetical protein
MCRMIGMLAVVISKMKVHPAMLMKKLKSRFWVSGAKC